MRHAAWLAACAAGLCLLAAPLRAQILAEPALQQLYAADKTDELQRLAGQRLAARADDAQAVLALALAALARDDAALRQRAIEAARSCTNAQPRAAACHYALGATLGVQAVGEGMLAIARHAGTVREALRSAHEIDPAWYPARSALCDFYLLAPGLMGGSAARAAELARGAPRPEQVQALLARVALQERRFEPALQALLALPAPLEPALAEDVVSWGVQAGMALVNDGQWAKAQPLFEKLHREAPAEAGPAYALARARGEAGDTAQALKLYERAAALRGAGQWPIQYRLGQVLQQLGRSDDARAAFRRFVALGKGPKNLLEEARKRLDQLGG